MKKSTIRLRIAVLFLFVGGVFFSFTSAQSTNGDIKLQIDPGTSCCTYGNSINFGRKGISFSGYEFTGDFLSTIAGPAWTCSDMYGVDTGWTLYVQMGTPLTNETNNIIPNQNVKITYGTTKMVGGKCAPYVHSGIDVPLNVPAILLEKDQNSGFNYGKICALQTPTVKMRVSIDPAQAPGNYTGTLMIDMPSFMGTCDPYQLVQGIFYDAVTDGLTYSGSMGSSGTTFSGGKFIYKLGEKITFSLGGLTMGTVLPNWDRKVFLPEVFGLSRTNITNTNVIKAAKLLQGLDQDNNPDNGIVISNALSNQITGTITGLDVEAKLTQLSKSFDSNLAVVQHLDQTLASGFQESGEVLYPWAKRASGTGDEWPYRIINNASGDVYVAGKFSGIATFGSETFVSHGGYDVFLSKLDSGGNFLWTKIGGGTDNDGLSTVIEDISGNLYIGGWFTTMGDFGGSIVVNTTGFMGGFIGKLDANGNWLKLSSIGTSISGASYVYGISLDHSGNVYVMGGFSGSVVIGGNTFVTSGGWDTFIGKLDSDRNWLWVKKIGGAGDDVSWNDPGLDNGGVYVGFYYGGTSVVIPGIGALGNSGSYDSAVVKLDVNGNFVWAKKFGGTSSDILTSLVLDNSGNVCAAGYMRGALFGSINLPTSGLSDIFVAKLDPNGNWLWAKKGGGVAADMSYQSSLAYDSNNNLYVVGGGGAGLYGSTSLTNSGGVDIILGKLDTNGNWLGAWHFGSGANETTRAISIDKYSDIYMAGYYDGPTKIENDVLSYSGGYDMFITRTSSRQGY